KHDIDRAFIAIEKSIEEGFSSAPTAGTMSRKMEEMLKGKTVLLVDDDMRNIYALTGALEANSMIVIPATNGKEAIRKLEDNHQVSIVLMDIMMPEMDGYQAMQHIRSHKKYNTLPIIALTAKAMK